MRQKQRLVIKKETRRASPNKMPKKHLKHLNTTIINQSGDSPKRDFDISREFNKLICCVLFYALLAAIA